MTNHTDPEILAANAAQTATDASAAAAAIFARYTTPVLDLRTMDPVRAARVARRIEDSRSVLDEDTGKRIPMDHIVPILTDADPGATAEPCALEVAHDVIAGEAMRRTFTPEWPQQLGEAFLIFHPIPKDSPLWVAGRSVWACTLAECVKAREINTKTGARRVPNTYAPRYLAICRTFGTEVQAVEAVEVCREANARVWSAAYAQHVAELREQLGSWDNVAEVAAQFTAPQPVEDF